MINATVAIKQNERVNKFFFKNNNNKIGHKTENNDTCTNLVYNINNINIRTDVQ